MKIINVKGIVILVSILIVVQLAFGLLISPVVGKIIIEQLNKHAGTKISAGKISVWPLTLSCSLRDLKVFDPDNENMRMAYVKKASIRLSPLRLLTKEIVLSSFNVSGAEINLKGEADGSFNIQKLARTEGEKAAQKGSILDRFKPKKDWFTRVYDMVKKNSSKEAVEKKKEDEKDAKKVTRDVVELPKGRRVFFKTLSDDYIFQIRNFSVSNAKVNLETQEGDDLSVEDASIQIKNLGVDPIKGARFDKLSLQGRLDKKGEAAGKFDLDYAQSFRGDTQKTTCSLSAREVNLPATAFIYQDSLPVDFTKGTITISSKTSIVNGSLDSANSLTLKNQNIVPGKGQRVALGIIPLPTLCDAMNQVDPLTLKFKITGTVDSPEFSGFQDSLMQLVKPYVADMTKQLQEKGVSAVKSFIQEKMGGGSAEGAAGGTQEESSEESAIDSIKSLFNTKEE